MTANHTKFRPSSNALFHSETPVSRSRAERLARGRPSSRSGSERAVPPTRGRQSADPSRSRSCQGAPTLSSQSGGELLRVRGTALKRRNEGRRWVFDRALSGEHAGTKPTDPATSLSLDLAAWIGDAATMDTADVANVIADAHRFQLIYPFQDTNGRTGRVLEHYILWVSVAQALSALNFSARAGT